MRIVVYGYEYCPYTVKAAKLAGVPIVAMHELTDCKRDKVLRALLLEVRNAKHQTIPVCFDTHKRTSKFIGGYDSLVEYLARKAGK